MAAPRSSPGASPVQPIDLTVTEPEGDDVMPTLVLQRPQGRAVLINEQQAVAADDDGEGDDVNDRRNTRASASPTRKSNRAELPSLDQATKVFTRQSGRRLGAGQAPPVMRGTVAAAGPQQLVDVNVEDASPDPKLPTSLTLVDHEPLPRNDHPAHHRRGNQAAIGAGAPPIEPPQHRPRRAPSVASTDSAVRYQANTRARGRVVESPLFCPRKSATGHTPGQPQPSLGGMSGIGKSPVFDLTAASDDDSDDEAVRVLLKTKQDASAVASAHRRQLDAASGHLPTTQQMPHHHQQLAGATQGSAGVRSSSAPLSLFAASDQLRRDQRREEGGDSDERPLRMSAKLNRRQWQVRLPDESASRMRRASAETSTTPRMADLASASAGRGSDLRKQLSAAAKDSVVVDSDGDDDDMPPPPARAATTAAASSDGGVAAARGLPPIALPPPLDEGPVAVDGMAAPEPSSPAVDVEVARSAPPPLVASTQNELGGMTAASSATERSPSAALVNKHRAMSVEAVLRAPLGPPLTTATTGGNNMSASVAASQDEDGFAIPAAKRPVDAALEWLFPEKFTVKGFTRDAAKVVTPQHVLAINEFWSAFTSVTFLGEGSFGFVWKCVTLEGKTVAVKSSPIAFDCPEAIDDGYSVLREIAVVKFLNKNKVRNVLPMHAAFFCVGNECVPPAVWHEVFERDPAADDSDTESEISTSSALSSSAEASDDNDDDDDSDDADVSSVSTVTSSASEFEPTPKRRGRNVAKPKPKPAPKKSKKAIAASKTTAAGKKKPAPKKSKPAKAPAPKKAKKLSKAAAAKLRAKMKRRQSKKDRKEKREALRKERVEARRLRRAEREAARPKVSVPHFYAITREQLKAADATVFMVTQLCDGDLDSIDASADANIARGVALSVSATLHDLHRLGLVHLDLKPGNILYRKVKIVVPKAGERIAAPPVHSQRGTGGNGGGGALSSVEALPSTYVFGAASSSGSAQHRSSTTATPSASVFVGGPAAAAGTEATTEHGEALKERLTPRSVIHDGGLVTPRGTMHTPSGGGGGKKHTSVGGNAAAMHLPQGTSPAAVPPPPAVTLAVGRPRTRSSMKVSQAASDIADGKAPATADDRQREASTTSIALQFFLSDFGNCQIVGPGYVDTVKCIGTYQYMDHAALSKQQCDRSTDCYSLGMTLYRLLTGKLLHTCKRKHAPGAHRPPCYVASAKQKPPAMQGRLGSVIYSLLSVDKRVRMTAAGCYAALTAPPPGGSAPESSPNSPRHRAASVVSPEEVAGAAAGRFKGRAAVQSALQSTKSDDGPVRDDPNSGKDRGLRKHGKSPYYVASGH